MAANLSRFSLYKRRNQIYYIGYYHSGKRHWKSTGVSTRPDALKVLTAFRELLQKPTSNVSLREFVCEFLRYSEANHAPKTAALFRSTLNSFLKLARIAMLGEITAEHIDRYKTKRNREVSPVSVNVELRMLKSAFSTAKRWKLIEGNPCDGVPFVDVPEQVPLFLTGKECQTLVDCIREGWFRELVLFAVLTGLKRGEILSLRWADVDLSRRVVNIQTSSTFRTKQGRRRTVTLNDSAFYLLSSKQGKSCAEYVFTLNDKPIFDGWVTHLFKKYVRRAKLSNDRLHFHSLRHTFASRLVQKGATLYEVQRLLGHTSSKVTEVYSRLQPEQLHSTVNRIDVSVN